MGLLENPLNANDIRARECLKKTIFRDFSVFILRTSNRARIILDRFSSLFKSRWDTVYDTELVRVWHRSKKSNRTTMKTKWFRIHLIVARSVSILNFESPPSNSEKNWTYRFVRSFLFFFNLRMKNVKLVRTHARTHSHTYTSQKRITSV